MTLQQAHHLAGEYALIVIIGVADGRNVLAQADLGRIS